MQVDNKTHAKRAGFTLIELMIVVVIIGILATLAVPAYSSFVYQARANEGVHMLSNIGMRQESYYAEFGRYVDLGVGGYPGGGNWGGAAASFMPNGSLQDENGVGWPAGPNNLNTVLGIVTTGRTFLSYQCAAGGPGNAPAAPVNLQPQEWWVAAALADLDGDGVFLTIELTSQRKTPWISSTAGFE